MISGRKRTTIQDVATEAGVSTMTVSRALSPNASISEKTRNKVLKVVERLKYRPNVSARHLSSNKSYFLGLLYNNPSESYVSKFILSALKHCRKVGYHLVADECERIDNDSHIDIAQSLINETQVDGFILLPPLCDDLELVDFINQQGLPIIRVAPEAQLNKTPYVCINDYDASFQITEYLIRLGHKNIAFIKGDPNIGASRSRLQGFLDAMRSNQLTIPDDFIQQGYFDYESGMSACAQLMLTQHKPTAIVASNDDMASAAVSVINRLGYNVPEDISVVGYDDTPIASTMWPKLTTVEQPIEKMALEAINLFYKTVNTQGHNLKISEARHVLDFKIVERESTAPLKRQHNKMKPIA